MKQFKQCLAYLDDIIKNTVFEVKDVEKVDNHVTFKYPYTITTEIRPNGKYLMFTRYIVPRNFDIFFGLCKDGSRLIYIKYASKEVLDGLLKRVKNIDNINIKGIVVYEQLKLF